MRTCPRNIVCRRNLCKHVHSSPFRLPGGSYSWRGSTRCDTWLYYPVGSYRRRERIERELGGAWGARAVWGVGGDEVFGTLGRGSNIGDRIRKASGLKSSRQSAVETLAKQRRPCMDLRQRRRTIAGAPRTNKCHPPARGRSYDKVMKGRPPDRSRPVRSHGAAMSDHPSRATNAGHSSRRTVSWSL